MPKWWIGCSGFHYKEWKEVFYPKGIPQTKWFEFYSSQFNTIELNTTFYRFPRPEALQAWYHRCPTDFRFSVKAPRLITHYKNFKESESMLGDFYASVYEGLGDKLGCVLFQLPSRLPYSDELLNRIIENVDPSFDNVIEFRHDSWWSKKIYNKLKKHSVSFCGISHPELTDEVIRNTSILYYRFHGVPVLYKSEYKKNIIKKVKEDIKDSGKFSEAYVYFNNTWGMGGINNARHMQEFLLT
ncbi:MAG: DUF72 domain-containing protein [Chitinophagaceae bacterium]|nr:DUF72 domain-containing protein [Chitinophagaceae bacterium]